MKFFIVFALCLAAVSARFIIPDVVAAEAAEIQEILAAINNPSTDPATAAALQQLLADILGVADSPIHVGPAIIDEAPIAPGPVIVEEIEESPIHVGPAIVDEAPIAPGPVIVEENEESPIHVGPAIVDEAPIVPGPVIVEENEESPIHVGPAIIDEIVDSPIAVEQPTPSSSPLVQVIINVKSGAQAGPKPVEVIDASPVIVPEESLILPGPGIGIH